MKYKKKYFFLLLITLVAIHSCHSGNVDTYDAKIEKVLILGNSIVSHDPAPEIGWYHNWGMAASSRDSDFVHILSSKIHELDTSVIVLSGNLSVFENNYETYNLEQLADYRNFDADILIIKISENVKYTEGMDQIFIDRYTKLIDYLAPNTTVKIIVEGFWPSPVNDMMKRYAESKNLPFVKLADLFENDKSNAAIGLFEHEGVANHPSDKGMRNIAERIWVKIAHYIK